MKYNSDFQRWLNDFRFPATTCFGVSLEVDICNQIQSPHKRHSDREAQGSIYLMWVNETSVQGKNACHRCGVSVSYNTMILNPEIIIFTKSGLLFLNSY